MGNLIKNEFIKVLKKKSTLIILIIFLLYVILTNVMVKYMSSYMNYNYLTNEDYVNSAREQIKDVNPKENPELYADLKTTIDFYDLYNKYDKDSWQAYIIQRDFYDYISNVNLYKYGTVAQKQGFIENPEEIYNAQLEKLNNNDWKEFVKGEIKSIDDELIPSKLQYEELKNNNEEIDSEEGLKYSIQDLENKRKALQYRLDNDIPYGNDYLNSALAMLEQTSDLNYDYNKKELSYSEKVEIQGQIQEREKAKYILEHKQDINNTTNLRLILSEIYSGYAIFIIVFIIMIAGTTVSSEFEKGTIKMLLIKPYKRWKILLAKYIVSLIMMVIFLAFVVIAQTIIGGLILGFDSLSVPIVEYSFKTNSIVSYNIFQYILIETICVLPMFTLIATLSFMMSTVFINSAVAIVIPIIGYIAGNIINETAIMYSIKQLKYFITLNWDFTEFLFGKLPRYEFTNFKFAIIICIIYWLAMLAITFVSFKKRQIKNI